jgi:hypothetical protein
MGSANCHPCGGNHPDAEAQSRALVRRPAEWRWMASGDESSWFPGFRNYRQSVQGDWSAALAALKQDLASAFA